ncbi:MAG: hypothetical protein ACEPOW_10860 [Bacteroidales bacterium]
MSNKVWIVDTSVLCNILSIPNMNQDKAQVLADFKERIKDEDQFLLPYTVVIETGNHIGQTSDDRYALAAKFTGLVDQTIKGKAPWKLMKVPNIEKVSQWLKDFPNSAAQTKGYGDHSIIKEWKEFSSQNQGLSVEIWSLDSDLAGYQSKSKVS